MNQDMNTIYGPDIWNYGAKKPRNCGEGFGERKAIAAITKGFSRFLRFAAVLLLMVAGVSEMWGQDVTFEVTTTDDITNHTEKLYWIESGGADGFYMIPDPDNINASTTNAPNEKMLWYFMDASEGNTEYYYVVNYKINKANNTGNNTDGYLKLKGDLGANGSIGIGAYDSNTDDKFKFSIEQNGSVWAFYPKEKDNKNARYTVNKQGSNVSYKASGSVQYMLKASTATASDVNSQWKLVAYNDVTWAHPFTSSTNNEKHYYYIHNSKTTTLYMNIDGSNYVTVSNADNDNRVWYFEEAESDTNIPNLKYYYIVNAETGNYMYYNGAITGDSQVNSNVKIQAHSGGEEDRYKFAIVNAIGKTYSAYSIMPKLLMDKYDYSHRFNSLGASSTDNNTKISTRSDRGSDTNDAHWTIEALWGDPVVTCDDTGTITITGEDGATFYYTTDGSTPTTGSTPYNANNKPKVSAGITTIKVRAIAEGKSDSRVITQKIVYVPNQTFESTYDGTAQTPVVKVGETTISSDEYNVIYKQGETVVTECKDAGEYTVTITDIEGGEYIVYGSGSFTINKVALSVTANNKTITYGDEPANNGVTYSGFIEGESETVLGGTLDYDYSYTQFGNVGDTYTITPKGLTATNYEITYNPGTLTVDPKEVGLTWSTESSFDYDGLAHTITADITGQVNGDEIGVTLTQSAKEGSSLTGENAVNAGSYTVTASALTGEKAGNYSLPLANTQDFTISKVTLTVTANPHTITYGDVPTNDGVTYSGFVNDESETVLGGSLDYEYNYTQFDNVGDTYTITPKGLTATNYEITYNPGTLTVGQKEVGLDWSSASLTYNGNAQAPTATATGVMNGDEISVTVTGTETNVGTGYTATASELTGTKAGNYKLPADNTTTFEISAKAVTITAQNASKTYNSLALTEGGFTVSALEDGDEHTFTVVMTEGSTITNVGTQPNVIATVDGVSVTAGTETAVGNYKVTTVDGTLTVNAKAVTITANDATKEYNGEPLTEGGFTTTALEEGDTHTFTVVMTAESTVTNVGTPQPNVIATVDGVSVTTGTETAVGNYLVTTVNGTLTVTKKLLTITAESGEKEYDGTALTKDTYTYEGTLYSGDAIESVTVTGSQIVAGSSDNVPSAAVIKKEGTDVTENYQITYVNGTLTVTKKALTITADGDTKEYDGTPLTKNTYTNSALATGDAIESVTVTGSQTDAGTSDNVPSDAVIKNSASEIVTACYEITYTNGTLTVTPAAATVTAEAKTKVYGDEEPTYTATVTGLKNNEAASVLTYTFSRETGEDVGEYTITPAGEATQGNYTVTYATAKLTITKAAATVKADDKTKGYGDADQLTATVTGLKNGDDESVITFTLTREEGEDVNAVGYTITPSGAAEQGNYTVTYKTGTLTITPKAINDGTNPAEGIDVDITYDGTNYSVVVKQGEKTLVKDTDYELPEGNENQYDDADGNHVITIQGKDGSNYTGSFKATYIKLTFWDTTPDDATKGTTAAVYCASQNLKVNESFEAHYVTNLENNVLTLTKVEAGESKKNYIPANQPMILISDATPAPMGFTLKPYTDTEVVTIPEGSNLLKVVTAEGGLAVALTQVYIFSLGEFVLTKEGTMSKGKFYLDNPNYSTPAPSRGSLRIVSDDTTGINTSLYLDTDSHHSDTWYTIGGQKLNKKPTRKGLYLQNGRKIMIK